MSRLFYWIAVLLALYDTFRSASEAQHTHTMSIVCYGMLLAIWCRLDKRPPVASPLSESSKHE